MITVMIAMMIAMMMMMMLQAVQMKRWVRGSSDDNNDDSYDDDDVAGCADEEMGQMFKSLFETPYYRCTVVEDVRTVECCGALKVVLLSCLLACSMSQQHASVSQRWICSDMLPH